MNKYNFNSLVRVQDEDMYSGSIHIKQGRKKRQNTAYNAIDSKLHIQLQIFF